MALTVGAPKTQLKRVQVYGRKKTATALAVCKEGTGVIRVNGRPLKNVQPEVLREKAEEPIHLLGSEYFKDLDIHIRVRGGGQTAQIYAVRQAIARGLVAFLQKYVDETRKAAVKSIILAYDRSLLVADPRLCESKKFGGPGARARYQKSYR